METWSRGGELRERIVLNSEVLFGMRGRKVCVVGGQGGECDERCHIRVRVKTFSPSSRLTPSWKSGVCVCVCEEGGGGTVSITQIK